MTVAWIAIGVSVLTLILIGLTVRVGRKNLRLARKYMEDARNYYGEAEEKMFWTRQAGQIIRAVPDRHDPDAPMSPELSVVIEHKNDPVLRPYKVLMILLPDPHFEEIHELGKREFVTVAATSAEANKALAEADYAIVCKDAEARVIKWRDRSEEQIEIEFYGVPSQA